MGDLHGLNTLEYQPAKIAAMEGLFDTRKGAPLILFGIPDMGAEETRYAIQIPKLGSLILTHDADGEIQGLKAFPRSDRPNALVVFWSFRIMLVIGFGMLFIGLIRLYLRWRKRLYDAPLFHRTVILFGPSGFIAVVMGWITTEVGRQPFTVYGYLRTADSVSPVALPAVAASLAAFAQGIVLGAFVQGIEVEGRAYAGGWLDWLSPFSLFTGIAVVMGYALPGTTYLILKTEGGVRDKCYQLGRPLFYFIMIFIVIVSLATPMLAEDIAVRWYSWPNILYLAPIPVLVAVSGYFLRRNLNARNDIWPFPLTLGLFVLSFIGLGVSIFPYVVPRAVTVAQAAAPDSSLGIMLIGAVILLPLILAYTFFSYWVFRGKVRDDESYH